MGDLEQHPDAPDIERAMAATAAELTERQRGALWASLRAIHDDMVGCGVPDEVVHMAMEASGNARMIHRAVLATLGFVDEHPPPRRELEDRLSEYLAKRGHTLSFEDWRGRERVLAQAEYVLGEAEELVDAVEADKHDVDRGAVFDELADVVLSATALARYLGTTVEECIERKTRKDTGRG